MRQLSSCEAGVSVGRLHMMWHSYIQLPATATELIATESTARSCHVCWLPRERHTNRHIKLRRRAVCMHAADRLALDFFNHSVECCYYSVRCGRFDWRVNRDMHILVA